MEIRAVIEIAVDIRYLQCDCSSIAYKSKNYSTVINVSPRTPIHIRNERQMFLRRQQSKSKEHNRKNTMEKVFILTSTVMSEEGKASFSSFLRQRT